MDVLVKWIVQKTYKQVSRDDLLKLFEELDTCLGRKMKLVESNPHPEKTRKVYTNLHDRVVELQCYKWEGCDYVDIAIAGRPEAVADIETDLKLRIELWKIFRSKLRGVEMKEFEDGSYVEKTSLFEDYKGDFQKYFRY